MNVMTELKNFRAPLNTPTAIDSKYRQVNIQYDAETRSVWTYLTPTGTTCFNLSLLKELRVNDREFESNSGQALCGGELWPVDYFVAASGIEHIFNYGGDLALFVQLIKSRDRNALLYYATLCVDCVYARLTNYKTAAITIALVQGDALGGGFETVLASNVIIAEETALMGFPEILFNLFPGMGAYSLLARRIGAKKAEEIIISGQTYDARTLKEMGLVDIVVAKGEGERAVYEYMRQNKRRLNGMQAVYACRHHNNPITYQELMRITEVWVDAALRINDRDLRMMGRIVQSQMRRQRDLRKNGFSMDSGMDCFLAAES